MDISKSSRFCLIFARGQNRRGVVIITGRKDLDLL